MIFDFLFFLYPFANKTAAVKVFEFDCLDLLVLEQVKDLNLKSSVYASLLSMVYLQLSTELY